jgi:hypothetical protein
VATQLVTQAEQHHQRLVAIVDADPAGRSWGGHLTGLLAERGHQLAIVEPPAGLDLNAWALDDATWTAALDDHRQPTRRREPTTVAAMLDTP